MILAIWLLGALAQGLLLETSLTARRIWIFSWWFQKFALGVLVGFVLGYVACLARGRRRSAT